MTEAPAGATIEVQPEGAAVDDRGPLLTLADLGRSLHVACGKAVRRALDRAMRNDPGLRVTLRGRSILFTPEQFDRTLKALEWRSPSGNAARSGTREVRYASGARSSASASSAQDVVLERMRKLRQRPKKRASAPTALTVLPGGRGG